MGVDLDHLAEVVCQISPLESYSPHPFPISILLCDLISVESFLYFKESHYQWYLRPGRGWGNPFPERGTRRATPISGGEGIPRRPRGPRGVPPWAPRSGKASASSFKLQEAGRVSWANMAHTCGRCRAQTTPLGPRAPPLERVAPPLGVNPRRPRSFPPSWLLLPPRPEGCGARESRVPREPERERTPDPHEAPRLGRL